VPSLKLIVPVKYIDESFREAIGDIAEEVISDHNDTEEHLNQDSV
jgi:hypothetical protein